MTDLFDIGQFDEFRGMRVGIEQKWFFIRHDIFRVYTGLELAYHNSFFDYTEEFFIPEEDPENLPYEPEYTHFQETFEVQKAIFNISPRVGIQAFFGRFVLEGAFGIGIKHRNAQHPDRQTPLEYRYDPNSNPVFPGLASISSRESESWTLTIPTHAKIGFTF